MRTIFCSLLSASLLLHAAFGCCRHEAEESEAGLASTDSHVAAPSCCHDHAANAHGKTPHEPCKNHPHCQGMCNYLPAQKSQVDKHQVHLTFDLAVGCDVVKRQDVCNTLHSVALSDPSLHLPLRLHLLHQILLI